MALEQTPTGEQNLQISDTDGTLAIDLGSTTTVVAFQSPQHPTPQLLNLDAITRYPGQVPSLIWAQGVDDPSPFIGRQVVDAGLAESDAPQLHRDFKRAIGAPASDVASITTLAPEAAAQVLLQQIWRRLPPDLRIHRLVLTAPVDHYRGYRQWLLRASESLPVDEVALVDEPTAAALGAGLAAGARLLVVDLGGSTIDISMVELEGGEGRAAPLAQLLRFRGRSLQDSRQTLRCAKVLGKAGLALGGRDLDRWIVEHLHPSAAQGLKGPTAACLNAAERLKCRLSSSDLDERTAITELATDANGAPLELQLNRRQLETLLNERGLLDVFDDLLERTLAGARQHGCQPDQLQGVLPVGGGAQMPLLRQWLSQRLPGLPLLEASPVEAVATGALSLTPGVKVRDVLQRGVSLRCWDQRAGAHLWHPLFVPGQVWPSEAPLQLVLAASHDHQEAIELVLGEPENLVRHDVVFVNGLPSLRETSGRPSVRPWEMAIPSVVLDQPGMAGQDCLRLSFHLNDEAQLVMTGTDLRTGKALPINVLGQIR